ncbi:thioredoxin family protein [Halomicrococcus sp. NG-SE-24]|uniref:thioredoxin family protein n=1 Tax=Halomicrococcus sp. NG-SE-24 TaxID=3436928 RepID=UPI003D98AECB
MTDDTTLREESARDASEGDDPDHPVEATDGEELDRLVAEHDLVLAEFYTKGCALCQAIEPVLGNVARATDATVVTVNPGDDLDLVDRFDVRSVPTLLLFEDGDLVDRMAEGFQRTEAVVDFVERRGDAASS